MIDDLSKIQKITIPPLQDQINVKTLKKKIKSSEGSTKIKKQFKQVIIL
jgi:hypothetical protein